LLGFVIYRSYPKKIASIHRVHQTFIEGGRRKKFLGATSLKSHCDDKRASSQPNGRLQ